MHQTNHQKLHHVTMHFSQDIFQVRFPWGPYFDGSNLNADLDVMKVFAGNEVLKYLSIGGGLILTGFFWGKPP